MARCSIAARTTVRRGWFLVLALLLPLLCWPISLLAQTAPPLRFGAVAGAAKVVWSQDVLTAEERAFLASLPEVRVAIPTPPNRPYEEVAADGTVSGVFPDLLVALSQTFGLRLKAVSTPSWSATLEAARKREVDIVMTIGVTTERTDYLAFTLGATPVPGALFARPGMQVDLARARIALERDYVTHYWVTRQYPNATVVTVDSTRAALQAVASGQADAYVGGLLEAVDALSRQPVPGVEVSRLVSYGTGFYHFGVRKDWAPLAAILNKGIQSLRTKVEDDLLALPTLPQMPSGLTMQRLLKVDAAEADFLANTAVWRVGAVRGLQLLNEVDERGLHSGIAAEYTEQVARRLGVAIQLRAYESVAAMIAGLEAGEIDVIPYLTRTDKRAQRFGFSAPYVEMPYALVARDDSPMYWNLGSLRGKRLALAPQHPLRDLLAERYPDVLVVDAPPGLGAMEMVLKGQAEAAVEVKLFANLRINAPGGHRLRMLGEVEQLPAQFHFATRKDHPVLMALIDRALADIDPAERQRMLRRWVAVDLQPAFPWRLHLPWMSAVAAALLLLALGSLWWMRRLQREVQARRRSEQLLNDIATTVPGLAFRYVINADGSLKHHFFTPGAAAFLGRELSPRQTVVDALAPYIPAEDLERVRADQTRSMQTGQPFRVTCRYQPPRGPMRWLHAEALQTRSSKGAPVWTGYVVDVSAEHQLQQRLAQEAQSRSLMLASASHELRAPTHTLSLALQSLSPVGLDDEQQRAVQVAQESAHTLAELLSDVLDAARPGAETLQLRPRTFDLHQLLDSLSRAWRAAARTKGLAFELDIAPEVPRTLQTDPLRLKQVLINLLSNACKYTAQGQVALRARRTHDGLLCIEVADTGIGIDSAAQARLFAPFVTLDDPQAPPNNEGSSGLGLAHSQRVAALMHGRIELHSAPGQGTQAQLLLPWPQQDTVVRPAGAGVGSGPILICDDDETSRLLLVLMLRRQGFETLDTPDGDQALALWRQGGVRAMITDLDLPGMNGLELIRQVRAEEGALDQRMPVVVCSGSPVPRADADTHRAHYDAYFVKPVDVRTLAVALERLGVVSAGP